MRRYHSIPETHPDRCESTYDSTHLLIEARLAGTTAGTASVYMLTVCKEGGLRGDSWLTITPSIPLCFLQALHLKDLVFM